MDIRLPIRLSIVEGESFSGYIIRSARAMDVDCKEFLKYIISNYNIHYKFKNNIINIPYPKIASSIDVFPFKILKENGICSMFNKSKKEIENATFKNIFDVLDVNVAVGKEYLRMELIKNVRKFCPLCLKYNGIYKLEWQIKEIEICDIHKIKLADQCGVCNSKQKYFSTSLQNYRCEVCNSLLWEKINKDELDVSKLNEQILIYKNWKFLLNTRSKLVKVIPNYSFSQSLAITMLYVAQNQEDVFRMENIDQFHRTIIRNIVRHINDIEKGEKISLNSVKRITKAKNILLDFLPNIEVPISYIQSLLKQEKEIIEFTCLSPWCDFFGKNDKIVVLGKYKSKRRGIIKKFVCTQCNIRFGYNSITNMCEPLNQVLFNNIPKVRKLALKNKFQRDIANILGISLDLCSKILAYLLSNNLLNDSIKSDKHITIPTDIKDKFEILLDKNSLVNKKASKILGWSYFEFSYYYWLPEIQSFLIDREKDVKSRNGRYSDNKRDWRKLLLISIYYFWKRDIDISYENINKYFQISKDILHRHQLIDIFKMSVMLQENKRRIMYNLYIIKKVTNYLDNFKYEKVFLKDLLAQTRTNQFYLKRHYPDLKEYLVRKVRIHNSEVKKQKLENYKKEIEKIYLNSIENGELETIRSISLKLGKEYKFISRCAELNAFTKKLLDQDVDTKSDN
ncbi:TniQ family protein [Clostridium butyricum]|uniref:TniQ family protein n=1 Tax=Clostridium butyricum TaxID=1492 RepID=UPI003466576C